MKLVYCDFCGAKLLKNDFVGSVDFKLEPRFGGKSKTVSFEGCSHCIDEVHDMVTNLAERSKTKK
jgi:hypothetical protein